MKKVISAAAALLAVVSGSEVAATSGFDKNSYEVGTKALAACIAALERSGGTLSAEDRARFAEPPPARTPVPTDRLVSDDRAERLPREGEALPVFAAESAFLFIKINSICRRIAAPAE